MNRTCLVIALLSSLAACKSKEEQACHSQDKWLADLAERMGEKPEPMTKAELAECIAEQKTDRNRFKLDDAGYEALRRTWPLYARGIQEHFARHLPGDEAAMLARALQRVADAPDAPAP